MLISGYIKEHHDIHSGHMSLIVLLSCLSSSSHLACLITLRGYLETHRFLARLRVWIIILFALALSVTIAITDPFRHFRFLVSWIPKPTLSFGVVSFLNFLYIGGVLYLFWVSVLQLLTSTQAKIATRIRSTIWPWCRKWLGIGRLWEGCQKHLSNSNSITIKKVVVWSFWNFLFGDPLSVFALQIIFAFSSVTLVLLAKFYSGIKFPDGCNLSTAEENAWGFGQILPMFLLLLPVLSAAETYFGRSPNAPQIFIKLIEYTEEKDTRKNVQPGPSGGSPESLVLTERPSLSTIGLVSLFSSPRASMAAPYGNQGQQSQISLTDGVVTDSPTSTIPHVSFLSGSGDSSPDLSQLDHTVFAAPRRVDTEMAIGPPNTPATALQHSTSIQLCDEQAGTLSRKNTA